MTVMDDYRLSEKSIIRLKQEHRHAKTKWEADRLTAIYLPGEATSAVAWSSAFKVPCIHKYSVIPRHAGMTKERM